MLLLKCFIKIKIIAYDKIFVRNRNFITLQVKFVENSFHSFLKFQFLIFLNYQIPGFSATLS